MNWGDWLRTGKVYASRAYTSLVGWLITIGTFAMVLYNDLIEVLPFMADIFPNSFVFMGVSIPIGLVILAKLGKWDWKKGTFPKEGETAFQNNPEWVAHRGEVVTKEYVDEKFDEVLNILKEREE